MPFDKIAAIAQALGVSRATVSKALNHCAGVGSEKREEILRLCANTGLYGKVALRPEHTFNAYVILPETPQYFWGELYVMLHRSLLSHGVRVKNNIYSRLGDDFSVMQYLREAEALDVDVVILAAKLTEDIRAALERQAGKRAIFLICSSESCKNAFDFGSNHYADGALLCRHCVAEHPACKRILIFGEEEARFRGFRDHFDGELRTLTPTADDTPATLARRLDEIRRDFDFEAAVCLDGIGRIMLMVLKKLKITVPCYGFERPPIEERYGTLAGEVCQDLATIAEMTAAAAAEYIAIRALPPAKHIEVVSKYVK